MGKPTVYLDTSFISAYWYEGGDVRMLARRLDTREWWELDRQHFEIWTSAFAEKELQRGIYPRQRECFTMVRRVRYFPLTTVVFALIEAIVKGSVVPRNKADDAGHMAIAAIGGMDYLISWNYAHMANAAAQAQFDDLCNSNDLRSP